MWRLIKKWWFLQRVEEIVALHTAKNNLQDALSGGAVVPTWSFVVYGTDDYPGIVRKPLGKYSYLLFWRNWENEEKLKRRVHEYNNFLKYWIERKYIVTEKRPEGVFINTTYLADDIHGWSGLIQLLADRFKIPWTIITAIITYFIARNLDVITNYLKKIINPDL